MSKIQKEAPQPDLSAFTQHPEVVKAMQELEEHFLRKKKIVSDIIDEEGNQYVNLVQEGGGVLGVALVGYTYVLEKMKIRFMRLAGTSAGAINTSLLTCIGTKSSEKSEKILDYLVRTNLFDFVDGHPFAKKLIGLFITNKSSIDRGVRWMKGLFVALVVLIAVDIMSLGLQHHYPVFSTVAKASFVLTGFVLLLCTGVIWYGSHLVGRFKSRGFGINPGRKFHDWIKGIMEENGVSTIDQLTKKAGSVPQGLSYRLSHKVEDIQGLSPDITLITSDIVSENKVEFPKMCNLFVDDPSHPECGLHPADFVRASMSIPIFFESFVIGNINAEAEAVRNGWQTHLSVEAGRIPASVRFVDGGILSNFPINIFYNPQRERPRLPTFGIRLNDADPGKKDPHKITLGSYAHKLFNTVRYYYDKDFLLKNNVYRKGIGTIDVHEFNWLNFGLSKEEQVRLFVKGVLAAKAFLIGSDNRSGLTGKLTRKNASKCIMLYKPHQNQRSNSTRQPFSPRTTNHVNIYPEQLVDPFSSLPFVVCSHGIVDAASGTTVCPHEAKPAIQHF